MCIFIVLFVLEVVGRSLFIMSLAVNKDFGYNKEDLPTKKQVYKVLFVPFYWYIYYFKKLTEDLE